MRSPSPVRRCPCPPRRGCVISCAGSRRAIPRAAPRRGRSACCGSRIRAARRAWVVEIPGTQDWWPLPGPNPFDLTGDVASLAGRATAAGEVVATALAAAGARTGEPVLLAGHSLGGMVAAGLAADPSFRSRFTVTHVLTAGHRSPTTRCRSRCGCSRWSTRTILCRRSTAGVTRTGSGGSTVRDAGGGSSSPRPRGGARRRRVRPDRRSRRRLRDPSIRAWCAGLAPFLAGRGVTGTGVRVVGSRIRRR